MCSYSVLILLAVSFMMNFYIWIIFQRNVDESRISFFIIPSSLILSFIINCCQFASLTRWTWVWVGSRSWWWTGKPGVLQSTGLQRVGHDWVTELNWSPLSLKNLSICKIEFHLIFSSLFVFTITCLIYVHPSNWSV